MVLTKTDNCSDLVIASDLIDDFVQNSVTHSLTITVTINCCSDPYVKTIDISDTNLTLSVPGATYTLDPAFFSFIEDVLLDGVYFVELKLTEILTGSYELEQKCAFIDCETKCLVFEYIRDNTDWFNVYTTYEAATWAPDCDDCDCGSTCTLYERLQEYLQITSPEIPGCNC